MKRYAFVLISVIAAGVLIGAYILRQNSELESPQYAQPTVAPLEQLGCSCSVDDGQITSVNCDGIKLDARQLDLLLQSGAPSVSLNNSGLSDDDVLRADWRAVRKLYVAGCPLSAVGFDHLAAQAGQMETLDVSAIHLSTSELISLSRFPRLTRLALIDTGVDGENGAELKRLRTLRVVTVGSKSGKNADTLWLSELPDLIGINFVGVSLTQGTAPDFEKFNDLKSVTFLGCVISDEFAQSCEFPPGLLYLEVSDCSMSAAARSELETKTPQKHREDAAEC